MVGASTAAGFGVAAATAGAVEVGVALAISGGGVTGFGVSTLGGGAGVAVTGAGAAAARAGGAALVGAIFGCQTATGSTALGVSTTVWLTFLANGTTATATKINAASARSLNEEAWPIHRPCEVGGS
jgi:hypothetical protein